MSATKTTPSLLSLPEDWSSENDGIFVVKNKLSAPVHRNVEPVGPHFLAHARRVSKIILTKLQTSLPSILPFVLLFAYVRAFIRNDTIEHSPKMIELLQHSKRKTLKTLILAKSVNQKTRYYYNGIRRTGRYEQYLDECSYPFEFAVRMTKFPSVPDRIKTTMLCLGFRDIGGERQTIR